jgi:phosphoglycolate phosphatase-like HAD superfamily hydrolase
MGSRAIFLFDIDGTLMRGTGPYHGNALIEAARRHTGRETSIDGIPVHGMLDCDILTQMLLRAGCENDVIESSLVQIMEFAQDIYPETCPDLRSKVLPGVVTALEELTMQGYPVGLVTGNLTRIGWTKVERAGLRRYFSFGAFADMGRTRAELARMACEMAGGGDPRLVTLIGDAPSDVLAARENGFRMVAVATGLTPREDLEALGADIVLKDLSSAQDREKLRGR